MATLAANTPQKFASIAEESNKVYNAEAAIYEGAVVVEGSAAGGVTNHTTGTTGFVGFAMSPASASGVKIPVRVRGTIVTSLAATIAQTDVGATVYAVANSTNPQDMNLTSTSNLPVGKIVTVLLAGASGANLVEVAFEADGLRSI
jgi:hypothetical protein